MKASARPHPPNSPRAWALIAAGLVGATLFLLVPLAIVFHEALRGGAGLFAKNITTPDALHATWLSLLAVAISLPVNLVFGLCGSWAIAHHRFVGRGVLLTLAKIPLSLSPIVAGVCYVMLYGRRGWFGPWLGERGIEIIFAFPGIVLVTIFVSLPYVLSQLVPLMSEQGADEEQAARMLGAGGWHTFVRVTLPKIRWGLLHGLLLANARALGEFGAVSVVSGAIRGETNTLPLTVDLLYNDSNTAGAFAAAALLALIALAVLLAKSLLEHRLSTAFGGSPAR